MNSTIWLVNLNQVLLPFSVRCKLFGTNKWQLHNGNYFYFNILEIFVAEMSNCHLNLLVPPTFSWKNSYFKLNNIIHLQSGSLVSCMVKILRRIKYFLIVTLEIKIFCGSFVLKVIKESNTIWLISLSLKSSQNYIFKLKNISIFITLK